MRNMLKCFFFSIYTLLDESLALNIFKSSAIIPSMSGSFIKILRSIGPRTEACGTPEGGSDIEDFLPLKPTRVLNDNRQTR